MKSDTAPASVGETDEQEQQAWDEYSGDLSVWKSCCRHTHAAAYATGFADAREESSPASRVAWKRLLDERNDARAQRDAAREEVEMNAVERTFLRAENLAVGHQMEATVAERDAATARAAGLERIGRGVVDGIVSTTMGPAAPSSYVVDAAVLDRLIAALASSAIPKVHTGAGGLAENPGGGGGKDSAS